MLQFKRNCMNENTFENWLVGVLGLMGGGIHYTLLQINTIPSTFWISLVKSGVTAFICALAGMTAKWIFNKISKNKSE